jgi:DNA-binding CsgD family transcriptional regulator
VIPKPRGSIRGEKLSPTEEQTLRLAALGYGNKTVAHIRGISENTVKNMLSRVYFKLGVHGLVEAMHRLGWIIIPDEESLKTRPSTLPLLPEVRTELAHEAVKLTAYAEAASEAARILERAADKVVDEQAAMLEVIEGNERVRAEAEAMG